MEESQQENDPDIEDKNDELEGEEGNEEQLDDLNNEQNQEGIDLENPEDEPGE